MSVNSSHNASLPSPPSLSTIYDCFGGALGSVSVVGFNILNLSMLLPLCVYVLFLCFRRWRRRPLSHSDTFTLHTAASELTSVLGAILVCGGIYSVSMLKVAGSFLCNINLSVQLLLQLLTCVERYVAAAHPVTYVGMKNAKAVRMRNAAIGAVWLTSVAVATMFFLGNQLLIAVVCFSGVFLSTGIIAVCNLFVLRVLIRPGPGEGGGARERVGQLKLRAFYTITAILGVLLFRLVGNILLTYLYGLEQLGHSCGLWLSAIWFSFPSSLVLPLLFLQRAGKLMCCKKTSESG